MDVLALVVAIIAAIVFLAEGRMTLRYISTVSLGLALLTIALIFQFTHITASVVVNH